ncbi:hypothetical protein DN752_21055 [Echinicola strongylocentroti]|uniref:Peptidase S49 domain-containing protein n=2 Tax=Echinicola strongylocentroti TaxID=1795355 RepID=A0A2Z4IMV0_9BACT|nr:hypothetical protein DN752_21055 [Echinicola strongylocentroti]
MAIHDDFLQEHFVRLSETESFRPHSIDDMYHQHEASLAIGRDYENGLLYLKANSQIAVIPIVGPTDKYGGWYSMGYMGMSTMLSRAKQSEKYKAVLFYVDSPGGTVDGIRVISNDIMNVGMPTLAFIDGLGASGGIWQSLSADRVLANSQNDNIIGSIGVQTLHVDRSKVLKETVGDVTVLRARQSTLKNKVNSYEPLSAEGKKQIEDSLSESAAQFIAFVQSRRPGIKSNSDVLKGEIYSGAQALNEGLIDGLSTLDEAIAELEARIKTGKSTPKNQNSSNKPESNMKFKAALTSILAVLGFAKVTSEDEAPMVTEERLEQINAELAAKDKKVSEQDTEITQLKADLKTAKDSLATAESDRDKYKADADKFGKQAGASHANPKKEGAEGGNTEEDENSSAIAKLPHNAALDNNPMFN